MTTTLAWSQESLFGYSKDIMIVTEMQPSENACYAYPVVKCG